MQLRKLKKYVLLLLIAILGSCTQNINDNYCILYEPIYADYEQDTQLTIQQIDKNNLVYEKLCN